MADMTVAVRNANQSNRKKLRDKAMPICLVAPSALITILFLIIPMFYAFYCSLYRCDYMNFTQYLGFQNYASVLSSKSFISSIGLTFQISFISLAFSLILGILTAVWIDKSNSVIAYIMELIILIPWVTSMVVSALLWKWLFQDSLGLINYLLGLIGLQPVKFLSSKTVAPWTLIFVMTWRVYAYVMIQILAGLKAIPKDYEEAASIDGANRFQLFYRIKLPLLKTPLAISCIIVALSNINNVVVPMTLTGGGPGKATMVMGIQIYNESFSYFHFGESSAMSILMCIVNFILIVLYVKAVKYEIK